MSYSSRTKIVNEFSIKDFFSKYPKTLLSSIPDHTSDNAPRNEYSSDWSVISNKLKTEKHNRCEVCQFHLIDENKKFLHVHHIVSNPINEFNDALKMLKQYLTE
jgi:hypothetical protein